MQELSNSELRILENLSMRDTAIDFLEAVGKWLDSLEDADLRTVNQLAAQFAAQLAEIGTTCLPTGPHGVAILQVRDIAVEWDDNAVGEANSEVLFQWACRLPLRTLIEQLVLHGRGPERYRAAKHLLRSEPKRHGCKALAAMRRLRSAGRVQSQEQ